MLIAGALIVGGAEILVPRAVGVGLSRTPPVVSRKTRANRPSPTGARCSGVIYRQVPGVTTQLVQLKS